MECPYIPIQPLLKNVIQIGSKIGLVLLGANSSVWGGAVHKLKDEGESDKQGSCGSSFLQCIDPLPPSCCTKASLHQVFCIGGRLQCLCFIEIKAHSAWSGSHSPPRHILGLVRFNQTNIFLFFWDAFGSRQQFCAHATHMGLSQV